MSDAGPLIAIVEDDEAVRSSLSALLDAWGFSTLEFANGEALLEAEDLREADCVLLDVSLPGRDGISVLRSLRAGSCNVPVVMLTGHANIAMAVEALKAGAQDFLEKPYDDAELVRRIEAAITRVPTIVARDPAAAATLERLTPRESEVMREVVAGHANKVIAHNLGLSPKTVEIHRARVMEKTGSKTLSHLVRLALRAGIEPEDEHGE